MDAARVDPGSFRDPTSRVFIAADGVYRGLRADTADELREICSSDFFRMLAKQRKVVATEWVEDPPVGVEGWEGVLRHERIPYLSYPYEWSFEMLRDAALLQLELLSSGLDADIACKDASAYNVQFVGSRPVFIDVGSFERYRSGDPWFGYRQFCQLFLYPLMFRAYKDLAFQPWLRGSVDGITPTEARGVLGGRKAGRKGVLTHVLIHARAEARYADTDRDVKAEMKAAGFKKELIVANLKGLTKIVGGMEWDRSTSEWSQYGERAHYSDSDLERKTEFVRAVAGRRERGMVWDIGANDGRFSRLAAEHADHVVALDVDELVIDGLYKALRAEGNEKILPLVMNLADPSPGIGWRGRERAAFLDRGRPDLVLALAVIHHLAIGANVPIPEILELLAHLGCESVVEFPTRDDQMVRKLLRNKREGIHDQYDLDVFRAESEKRFEIRGEEALPSGTRVMFHLAPRA